MKSTLGCLFSIVLFFLAACSKNISTITTASDTMVNKKDIYIAGVVQSTTTSIAAYWKNDTIILLSDSTNYSRATAITKAGSDIYVAGSLNGAAVYWKNGKVVTLPTGLNSYITSIAVSGNDVYVAGTGIENGSLPAEYWKNGTGHLFSNLPSGQVQAIALFGSDTYMVGQEHSWRDNSVAKFWKNGVSINLTDGSRNAYANNIFLSTNDIYICGYEDDASHNYIVAKYWKNGKATILEDSSYSSIPYGIGMIDNDLYIAGKIINGKTSERNPPTTAVLWKNGIRKNITSVSVNSFATAMATSGADLYVLYIESANGATSTKYLKNDTVIDVTKGINASGYGIYVDD